MLQTWLLYYDVIDNFDSILMKKNNNVNQKCRRYQIVYSCCRADVTRKAIPSFPSGLTIQIRNKK